MTFSASSVRQSGSATTPTRNPAATSSRPSNASPKAGWSTYALPETRRTSSSSQPRASSSARDMGKTSGCSIWRGGTGERRYGAAITG